MMFDKIVFGFKFDVHNVFIFFKKKEIMVKECRHNQVY